MADKAEKSARTGVFLMLAAIVGVVFAIVTVFSFFVFRPTVVLGAAVAGFLLLAFFFVRNKPKR